MVTALASRFTARSKIAEVQTVYQQKLRDTYLENARKYTNSLYVPISVQIAALERVYRAFAAATAKVPGASPDTFKSACQQYLDVMADLSAKGANAFLTAELEDRLTRFNSLIAESLSASGPVRSVVARLETGWIFGGRTPRYVTKSVRGRWARFLDFTISIAGMRLTYSNELLAAPPGSEDFAKAFVVQLGTVRLLLKEVTLGTQTIT